MAGKDKVISLVDPIRTINDGLIEQLEEHLQLAKEGKILFCSYVVFTIDQNDFVRRGFFRCRKSSWLEYLGFTEMLFKEAERVRKFVEDIFEDED